MATSNFDATNDFLPDHGYGDFDNRKLETFPIADARSAMVGLLLEDSSVASKHTAFKFKNNTSDECRNLSRLHWKGVMAPIISKKIISMTKLF